VSAEPSRYCSANTDSVISNEPPWPNGPSPTSQKSAPLGSTPARGEIPSKNRQAPAPDPTRQPHATPARATRAATAGSRAASALEACVSQAGWVRHGAREDRYASQCGLRSQPTRTTASTPSQRAGARNGSRSPSQKPAARLRVPSTQRRGCAVARPAPDVRRPDLRDDRAPDGFSDTAVCGGRPRSYEEASAHVVGAGLIPGCNQRDAPYSGEHGSAPA
jgi:hypothetical protein